MYELNEARQRLIGLLRSRTRPAIPRRQWLATPGNHDLQSVIQDYEQLANHIWREKQRQFVLSAREALDEFSATKNALAEGLAETKQAIGKSILLLEADSQSELQKLRSDFDLQNIAPNATLDNCNINHIISSKRFQDTWYWVGVIALAITWAATNFSVGIAVALAVIAGYALFLLNQAQTCLQRMEVLQQGTIHDIDTQKKKIASAEINVKELNDLARTRFDARRGQMTERWSQLTEELSSQLIEIELKLQEVISDAHNRLDAFKQSDPVRSYVDDLPTQLEFRIGERIPSPIEGLPDDIAGPLHLKSNVPQLGSSFPVLYSLFERKALMVHSENKPASTASIPLIDIVLTRVLRQVPPGKATFSLFDPLGLGSNFGPYLKLQDFSDKLIDGAVWTSKEQIKRQLEDIISHIEFVNKRYLKADYENIDEFNIDAKEVREPYRFLFIADFPEGFTEDSVRDLVRIVQNGPRCGVHTIIYWNKTGKEFYGFQPDELARFAIHITDGANGEVILSRRSGNVETLKIDPAPSREHIKAVVDSFGSEAVEAMTVEVPFDRLYELGGLSREWWNLSSAKEISVPVGPIGANDAQRFRLDSRMSNNALVVGRPGSGKSNLMHVFISMVTHKYSPDQVELYLVDFKKGVEFKDYANAGLPHAKVIAVESEREFGLSVLRALDREMIRRSEVFKAAGGVEGLAQYRELDPSARMPRCVLLIDEFQELFSRDDRLKDEATVLLDRIVRQGRSFGVHVILGTQSLHNAGLMRSTIDQIPIRIALQCSEADSRAILADDNVEARSLSRPGEAIYNDMGGLLEGNRRFQVALFDNKDRKAFLLRQSEMLAGSEWQGCRPRVFEGHEAPSLADCEAISVFSEAGPTASIPLWIGEPVSLDPPISFALSIQAGRNLVVVGRDERTSAHLLLSAIVSMTARLTPRDLKVHIIDLTTADSDWADFPEALEDAYKGHRIDTGGKLDLKHVLPELCEDLERRKVAKRSDDVCRVLLVIIGAHRVRSLRRTDGGVSFGFDAGDQEAALDLSELVERLAEEGPEHGIHTMLWVDSVASFEKIYGHRGLEHFALRIAGPLPDRDSHALFESNVATMIDKPNRMIAYDDDLVGVHKLFRPYAVPHAEFFVELAKGQAVSKLGSASYE